MPEFRVYKKSQELYDAIINKKRDDYFLTYKIPIDISVNLGPTTPDDRNFIKRLFTKKNEPVICVGPMSNAKYLLAVNKELVERAGGRL